MKKFKQYLLESNDLKISGNRVSVYDYIVDEEFIIARLPVGDYPVTLQQMKDIGEYIDDDNDLKSAYIDYESAKDEFDQIKDDEEVSDDDYNDADYEHEEALKNFEQDFVMVAKKAVEEILLDDKKNFQKTAIKHNPQNVLDIYDELEPGVLTNKDTKALDILREFIKKKPHYASKIIKNVPELSKEFEDETAAGDTGLF